MKIDYASLIDYASFKERDQAAQSERLSGKLADHNRIKDKKTINNIKNM